MVSVNDKKYELIFSKECIGDHRKMVINGKEEANFFWGGAKNYNSSSFLADSALVDTIKSLITVSLISDLNKYCFDHSCPKSSCNYFLVITEKGTVYSTSMDVHFAVANASDFYKLTRLVRLLDDLYNRYAFPK